MFALSSLFIREPSVRPNVERIFRIWGERGIFDTAFVDELQALLGKNSSPRVSYDRQNH